MESEKEIAERVIGPVVQVVTELGLEVEDPEVVRSGANVVLHLAPSPVVARVATLTAAMRGDPAGYLRREREVTAALAGQGVDVVAPTELVDPGPHRAGDFWFVLMAHRRLTPVDLTSADHAKAAGHALADLERALAALPADLGAGDRGQPWDEVATLVTTVAPSTEPRAMDRIVEAVAALRAVEPTDGWRLVHGDAHRGNVALDGDRVVWFDFEDANHRPLAWDLASFRRSWPDAGDVACRLLEVDPSGFSMAWHHELREVYALLWNLLYAMRDQRVLAATGERLAGWLDRDGLSRLLARTDR